MMKKILLIALMVVFSFAIKNTSPLEKELLYSPKVPITPKEKDELIKLKDGEKFAKDVYMEFYNKFRLPLFYDISKVEKWHMHLITILLYKYDVFDPVNEIGSQIGKYYSNRLMKLFKKISTEGLKSVKNALTLSANMEEEDIKELDEILKTDKNEDIKLLALNLKRYEMGHLKDFVTELKKRGYNYKPIYLSQKELNNLLKQKNYYFFMQYPKNFPRQYTYPINSKILRIYPRTFENQAYWYVDIEDPFHHGKLTIMVAPVSSLPLKSLIGRGERIKVIKGYQGLYSIRACKFKDLSNGYTFLSNQPPCVK
jgi:hypothetical protein